MGENKRILIVDDEPDLLKTVAYRIKKTGYDVVLAEDGQEGLNKAKSENPDLIVLDWKLPVMNGMEVYRALQADDVLKNIPVIFLTASRESENLKEIQNEVGAERVMIKPYEPEELLAKLKGIIG